MMIGCQDTDVKNFSFRQRTAYQTAPVLLTYIIDDEKEIFIKNSTTPWKGGGGRKV